MTRSGILLILIGLVLTGTILTLTYAGNANFGGLIMIGPIPIAFGSSPEMTVIAMVIGFLMMIAFLLLSRRSIDSGEEEERTSYEDKKDRKVKGGGMILIGPIPIVFGSDIKYTLIIMILAIILMVLAILILLLK